MTQDERDRHMLKVRFLGVKQTSLQAPNAAY